MVGGKFYGIAKFYLSLLCDWHFFCGYGFNMTTLDPIQLICICLYMLLFMHLFSDALKILYTNSVFDFEGTV